MQRQTSDACAFPGQSTTGRDGVPGRPAARHLPRASGRESGLSAGWSEGADAAPLRSVRNLTKHYGDDGGWSWLLARVLGRCSRPVRAVDGVSCDLRRGQTLALVGESGCGKATLGRSIVGLLDLTDGESIFDGADISGTVETRPPEVRRQIQMVFQNPEASLNPRHTVGAARERPLRRFLGLGR